MKMNKRQLESLKTRQDILDVASALFMEKGFKNTSTREIAQRCNVTQPNLYYHFKNKKGIYLAVIQQLTDSVQLELSKIVASSQSLEDKLKQMIYLLLDKHPTNLFLMLNDMFVEMDPSSHADLYGVFKQTYLDNFTALFTQATSGVELQDGVSVADASRFVLYNVSSLLSIQQTYQKVTQEKDVEQFIKFILYGLAKQV